MADMGLLTAIGEFAKPIAVGIAAYVGTTLTLWWNDRRSRKPHKSIQTLLRDDLEISLILDRTLYKLGAMRVYLSQYHNGDAYLGGPDIVRKSRTHERVRPGLSYQQEEFKGVLVSTLAEESVIVVEEGSSWTRTRDIPVSKFHWLLERAGVKATARCAVIIKGRIVGLVGADFDTEEKPAEMDALCEAASTITQIIIMGQRR